MHSAVESLRLLTVCEVTRNNYRPLSHVEAATLSNALTDDGRSVAQTVFASLADALISISGQRFTWATIKLYYTVFYTLKALTMLDGISVFYRGSSPFSVTAKAGDVFKRRNGNSHSIVFDEFRSEFQSDILLSQPIGNVDALSWIEELRNLASYKTAPFPDPQPGQHFLNASERLRLNVSTYFNDDVPIYAFQEDHAIVALPILALKRLDQELTRRRIQVEISAHYMSILTNAGCDVASFRSLRAFALP